MATKKNDSKLFARNKASELEEELKKALGYKDKNLYAIKEVLKKIVANVTMNNNEMVALSGYIITQCLTKADLEVKKMCFLYIVHYARSIPKIAEDAWPVIFETTADMRSDNPLVRSLALKSVCYIRDYAIWESVPLRPMRGVRDYGVRDEVIKHVRNAMSDENPYVRKTAAFCVAKLHDNNRDLFHDRHDKSGEIIRQAIAKDLIDRLNRLLRDENPTVISSAAAALTDIWQRSEDNPMVLDYASASNLVQILPDCSEWGQNYILEGLLNYVPQNTSDAGLLAERICPRLAHSNSAVVLSCIRLLLYLFNYMSDQALVDSLCHRLSPPLVTLISGEPEIQYLALRNALLLLQRRPQILQNDIRVFFCNYYDPIYIKVTKLELVFMLANEKNIGKVLAELVEYATEIDVHFVRKSVRAIGKLAIKIGAASRQCADALISLISTKIPYIVQEATIVFRNIFRKYPGKFETVIPALCEQFDSLDEPEAKAAMIWILGEYADRIENSDTFIDDFLFSFKDETYEVQLALLTATVKLFILRPTKGSELVTKVLKWATEETDHFDLRERGLFYWRLLSYSQSGVAKQVVMGQKPPITADSENLDPWSLEELCLHIGTLATVYLKRPETIFRNARTRKLEDSPALQRQLLLAPQILANPPRAVTEALQKSAATNGHHDGLVAAVNAADEFFASLDPQRMANLQVRDDNLDDAVNQHSAVAQMSNGPGTMDLLI